MSSVRARPCPWILSLVLLAGLLSHAQGEVAASPVLMPKEERLKLCASCHNADGNSTIPEHPNLAGLHPRYLVQQLKDMKSGARKSDVMGAILMAVDEGEFDGLARHFARQKPRLPVGKVDPALVARGKPIFDDGIDATAVPACSGCHNQEGTGGSKYPRLAGQQPAYVLRQLQRYKSGERANDLRELMRAVAQRMTEDEMRAVAAYVSTLKGEDE